MAEFKWIKDLIEKGIEMHFSSQPVYQKVKDVLEGKAKKADIKAMVMDARVAFSAERKPELLMAKAIDGLKAVVVDNIAAPAREDISVREKELRLNLEKAAAAIENRASEKKFKVGPEEAVLSGRLLMDDGKTPVAGANVVVHGAGDNYSKVVAKAVTDANGEYAITLDEKIAKEAPGRLTVAFDSPRGENIAHSGDFDLEKGKVIAIDNRVRAEKKEAAAPLVVGAEDRKKNAELEMAALKKTEVVLSRNSFTIEKSVNEITAKLDGLKSMFVKETT